ncbi:MAG: hypothetical protein FWF57_06860 [Defluviitaleaceae bacterium]|nr:hypothetical protein [Defluviitaleaceae bacterium]
MDKIDILSIKNIISQHNDVSITIENILEYLKNVFGYAAIINKNSDIILHNLIKSDLPKSNFVIDHQDFKNYICMSLSIETDETDKKFLIATKDSFTKEDEKDIFWVSLIISNFVKYEKQIDENNKKIAKNLVSMLSYSELEAALSIFNEINNETLLIISKIADKYGFSRSVIGNCLRKLESSGAIEVHSLGMKGTNIKIINKKIVEEFDKIRV